MSDRSSINNNFNLSLEPFLNHATYQEDKLKRTIIIGNSEIRKKYNHFSNNKVTSTKYNLLSWLPKSIFMQFRRIANIYFLIIAILNFFYFSPKNPISMVITFGIILLFTSVREGVEDYQRYKKDKKANEKLYAYYNSNDSLSLSPQPQAKGFENKPSKKIHVGEIMKIFRDQELPCDICLLKSSNRNGICFIDSVNLDGESNLKDKKCNHFTQGMSDKSLCAVTSILKCEKPNDQLEYWEGHMTINSEGSDKLISLDNDQLLLKGSYLKNTDYIIGVVVYTGHETKIMQNAKLPKSKVTKFMKTINTLLYTVMISQLLLCFIFAYFSLKWQKDHITVYSYIIIRESNDFYAYLARVGTFLISYSQLIPISMYVNVEVLRLFQSPLIKYDKNLYDENSHKPAMARTSQLPDELGQIEYILSDKTGTLTKNNMILEKISIRDKIYTITEIKQYFTAKHELNGSVNYSRTTDNSGGPQSENNEFLINSNLSMPDSNPNANVSSSSVDEKIYYRSSKPNQTLTNTEDAVIEFFRLVNICNSIVIDYGNNGKNSSELNYQSISIDELALLNGSIDSGIILKDKTINTIQINFFNKYLEKWEILAILPFDSERKRMTIIAKSVDGRISLYCKGADEVIFAKLSNTEINIYKDINDIFARQGLRTLVMARKDLSPEYFEEWFNSYNEILNNMYLKQAEKYELFNKIFEQVERNMSYVGCSAIEDKLQDYVEETINLLKQANIKIWMLTGDKIENSIEIAKSCGLIINETCVFFTLRNISNFADFEEKLFNFKSINDNYCLVLDGKTLAYYELLNSALQRIFLDIILNSQSAICCRLTPKQKFQIVRILKTTKAITMAIGDGANDVPMILEANVGIGISGKEGSQAVRSADFSISQFQFLKDLLLVHGRLAYKRISAMTCYTFYKNIIVVFTEIYFIIFNGFSGQIFFSDWFTNFYNTFWSSWPNLINYCLDRDVDRNLSLKYPKLYTSGHKNKHMNKKVFWSWIASAFLHGAFLFWVPMLTGFDSDGKTKDHWCSSSISFTVLIHLVLYKLFIMTEHWNYLSIFGAVSCLICYYLCLYLFSIGKVASNLETKTPELFEYIFTNLKCILFVLLVPLLALLPDLMVNFVQKVYFLSPADIIKKIEAAQLSKSTQSIQ